MTPEEIEQMKEENDALRRIIEDFAIPLPDTSRNLKVV